MEEKKTFNIDSVFSDIGEDIEENPAAERISGRRSKDGGLDFPDAGRIG